ncbi:MAG: hypothetical protein MJ180_02350 [Candidatus Gastranaerophilales bacterium]|nr:hypothetical protein [Candidatus Gastranaerophilales bacterium]
MIENKIDAAQQQTVASTSTTPSTISRSYEKTAADERVSAKSAALSYATGLVEIAKTIYKKPILSSVTIAAGVALMTFASAYALPAVMTLSTVAGAAAVCYSLYAVVTRNTAEEKKQAYELMGISTFVLAIGVYGLLL